MTEELDRSLIQFDTQSAGSVAELRRRLENHCPGRDASAINAAQAAIIQIAQLAQKREVEKCKITKNASNYVAVPMNTLLQPKNENKQKTIIEIFLDKLTTLTFPENDPGGINENSITIFLYYTGWEPEPTGPRLIQLNLWRNVVDDASTNYTINKYREGCQETLLTAKGIGVPSADTFIPFLAGESPYHIELMRGGSLVMDARM